MTAGTRAARSVACCGRSLHEFSAESLRRGANRPITGEGESEREVRQGTEEICPTEDRPRREPCADNRAAHF